LGSLAGCCNDGSGPVQMARDPGPGHREPFPGQVPGDGVRAGVEPARGEFGPEGEDAVDGRRGGRVGTGPGPPGPRLERCLPLPPVAGDQPRHPPRGDPVGAGHVGLRPTLDNDSGDDQPSLRHAPTVDRSCCRCLETSVSDVLRSHTAGGTHTLFRPARSAGRARVRPRGRIREERARRFAPTGAQRRARRTTSHYDGSCRGPQTDRLPWLRRPRPPAAERHSQRCEEVPILLLPLQPQRDPPQPKRQHVGVRSCRRRGCSEASHQPQPQHQRVPHGHAEVVRGNRSALRRRRRRRG
jgi:hypothetical protein